MRSGIGKKVGCTNVAARKNERRNNLHSQYQFSIASQRVKRKKKKLPMSKLLVISCSYIDLIGHGHPLSTVCDNHKKKSLETKLCLLMS